MAQTDKSSDTMVFRTPICWGRLNTSTKYIGDVRSKSRYTLLVHRKFSKTIVFFLKKAPPTMCVGTVRQQIV